MYTLVCAKLSREDISNLDAGKFNPREPLCHRYSPSVFMVQMLFALLVRLKHLWS